MKLTVKKTAGLTVKPGKQETIYFDDDVPGFGLRVRAGGSRSWIFQYKIGSKHRRLTLGSAMAISLATARNGGERIDERTGRKIKLLGAVDLAAMVQLGRDPAGETAQVRADASETFGAVAKRFLADKRKELRRRSYTEIERHVLTHGKSLHALQLGKVKRADIATCINSVRGHSSDSNANRVRTSLSGFFSWAIEQGLVETNPVIGTKRYDEPSRDRVLSPDELCLIWNALADDHYGAIMRLLALTGQRAGEIAGLRWSEIQDDRIVLPGERTKNHRPHIVPLSEPARAIIAAFSARPRLAGADGKLRDFIFGNGQGPFSGWSNCKEALDARIAKATGEAMPHWTPHDLRRSFATHAAEKIGIQPHIIEAVLNHASGHKAGVAGRYNRATYEPEKRQALDRWAEHLMAIVEGRDTNILTFQRHV